MSFDINLHCYICKATDDLSIHARRKNMVSMICRPCRRKRSKAYPITKPDTSKSLRRRLETMSKESQERLMAKYG